MSIQIINTLYDRILLPIFELLIISKYTWNRMQYKYITLINYIFILINYISYILTNL